MFNLVGFDEVFHEVW